jgi:hypothetical protein
LVHKEESLNQILYQTHIVSQRMEEHLVFNRTNIKRKTGQQNEGKYNIINRKLNDLTVTQANEHIEIKEIQDCVLLFLYVCLISSHNTTG